VESYHRFEEVVIGKQNHPGYMKEILANEDVVLIPKDEFHKVGVVIVVQDFLPLDLPNQRPTFWKHVADWGHCVITFHRMGSRWFGSRL
jgi:hypothetical protein